MGALDQVHAADAYALGYTGAGVIVGVVDFNFQLGSTDDQLSPGQRRAECAGHRALRSADRRAGRHDPARSRVAGLIAAKKDDTLVHGIAFDAQVLAVDYFSNVNETQISQGGVLYHVSDPWTYITSRGVKILNVSFGYDAGDIIPNPPQVSEAYVIASPTQAVVNGALLVASAGNSGGANPSLSNQDIIAELSAMNKLTTGPGAFIIAGSVNANNQISSFSNRAGNARDHYMVAPGEDITVLWMGGLGVGEGTSFSAPIDFRRGRSDPRPLAEPDGP